MDFEDYFRTIFEEQLQKKWPVTEERYMLTRATQMLEKRKEIIEMDQRLKRHTQEFELKKQTLQHRKNGVVTKEDGLKDSLLHFDKFIKENDAKRCRGVRKAHSERQMVLQKEAEVEGLKEACRALEKRRQKLQHSMEKTSLYWSFLERVLKLAEFEGARDLLGHVESLLATREQLLQKDSQVQEQADSQRGALQRCLDEQDCLLLQKHNLLSQLQSQLDLTHSDVLRWDSKWTHIQNTAEKETLLLGQIKMATLNLYHMTGGQLKGKGGVTVDDTETQLNKIQSFIESRTAIIKDIQQQTHDGSEN